MSIEENLGYGTWQEQSPEIKLIDARINTDEGVQQLPNEEWISQKINLSLTAALDSLYTDVELIYCWKRWNYYVYDWVTHSGSQNILIDPKDNTSQIEDPEDGRIKKIQVSWKMVNKTTWELVNKREQWIGDRLIWLEFKVLEIMPCNSSARSNGDDVRDSQPY